MDGILLEAWEMISLKVHVDFLFDALPCRGGGGSLSSGGYESEADFKGIPVDIHHVLGDPFF